MALTVADLEDVQMRAREWVRDTRRQQEEAWFRPLRETLVSSMWRSLDPVVRDQLRLRNPEAAREMDKRYGGE